MPSPGAPATRASRVANAALSAAAIAGAVLWLGFARRAFLGGPLTVLSAAWLAAAAAAASLAFLVCSRAAGRAGPGRSWEVGRWLVLAAAAFWSAYPCYTRGSFGAGDAYWYTVMMADFTEQIRRGIFPVWIGQSAFAFNGAVMPLRVAPWLQHMAGLLDLATARSLGPVALKNALLCLITLAIAGSAYACLRRILPGRPWIALALALLWLDSPGVLSPPYLYDQYMTFAALPFLPPLLLGCRRLWIDPESWGTRLLVAVPLAGLWLAHTPMALWGSLLAAAMAAGAIVRRPDFRRWGATLAAMAALFLILGAWPIGSYLAIDDLNHVVSYGAQVMPALHDSVPGFFLPIDIRHNGADDCQLGYTLLAAGALALALTARFRQVGGAAFAIAAAAIVPLALPVPWLSDWLWSHAPSWFVTIENVWPAYRLVPYWGAIIVFCLAIAAADPRIAGRPRRAAALLAILAAGGLWTAREACKIRRAAVVTFSSPKIADMMVAPGNRLLTRYAYETFAAAPAYASQGYVDPLLENRLLDRRTGAVIASNGDAAAPPVAAGSPRLVKEGTWTAVDEAHSGYYALRPGFRLEPGRRYALRVDFARPDLSGVLQIMGDGLFREYLLPDSGIGLNVVGSPPKAFGSLPTSGRVIPLLQETAHVVEPFPQFIRSGGYAGHRLEFGRFQLYSYSPSDLPVRVMSWVPYKADVRAPGPVFLETPRVWQRGWHAQVNGREVPVRDSPNHLAMVPLGMGASHVVLVFRPPRWLEIWYWACLAGWAALSLLALRRLLRAAFPG